MFAITPFTHRGNLFSAYDPFREFDEFEKRFFGRQLPAFRTDVRETEKEYILDAELPGFKKEDIKAEISDGILTLHAERSEKTENNDENGSYIRRERSYGSFTRQFDLEGINADEISVSYKDGILSLTLPKKEEIKEAPRRLEIK